MKNSEIIKIMLRLSKQIKPYIYVKGQLDTLYAVELQYIKDDDVSSNTKKAIDSLAIKIALVKSKIFEMYRKLDGYNDKFNNIDYISSSDIEDTYIPVGGNTYLVIPEGVFIVINEDEIDN